MSSVRVATVAACCERTRGVGPGHLPAETVRVLATLRRLLRRHAVARPENDAEDGQRSSLHRALKCWARTGLLARVHALLVATAANPRKPLRGLSLPSRYGEIAAVFTEIGYDAEGNCDLCRSFGAEPCIHKRRQPSGSGLGGRLAGGAQQCLAAGEQAFGAVP